MKKVIAVVGGLVMMNGNGVYAAGIPELLKTEGGLAVTTVAQWEQTRRTEIFNLFQEHVYGRNPVGRPDPWAGPEGEFESCKLSSPAWALYGKRGLVGDAFPALEAPLQEGFVGYHIRPGKHDLTLYDWQRYMDFTDKHKWRE